MDRLGAYRQTGTTDILGDTVKGIRKVMGSPSKREGQDCFCYQICHLKDLVKILQKPRCGMLAVPRTHKYETGMGALRRVVFLGQVRILKKVFWM